MSVELQERVEDTIREQIAEGAGTAGAVFDAVRRKDEDQEGFMDVMILLAKLKANRVMRRVLSYIRPEARFQV